MRAERQLKRASPATIIGCSANLRLMVWKRQSSMRKCSRAMRKEPRVAPAGEGGARAAWQ